MIRRTVFIVCLAGLAGFQVIGCASSDPGRKKQKGAASPDANQAAPAEPDQTVRTRMEWIGEVSFVNERSGFVLVRSGKNRRIEAGRPMWSRSLKGEMVTGQLVASPERKSHFLAADIAGGNPAVGDAVYLEIAVPATQQPSAR